MPTPSELSYLEAQSIEMKTCSKCHSPKPIVFFHKRSASKDGMTPWCKNCSHNVYENKYPSISKSRQEYSRSYRHNEKTWAVRAVRGCRRRAKENAIPFNLAAVDLLPLPEECPVLHVKLDYKAGPNRKLYASVDRIIPRLGYVKSNVRIISLEANQIKSDRFGDLIVSLPPQPKPPIPDQLSLFEGFR